MNIFKSKLVTLSALALAAGITTASAKDTITVAMQLEPPHLDPTSAAAGAIDNVVYLKVFDLMGREVKTLVNSFQAEGGKSIRWDAVNNQGIPVSAGLYFYTIEFGEFMETKKMILIK